MRNFFVKKIIILLMITLLVVVTFVNFSSAFTADFTQFDSETLDGEVTDSINGLSGTVIGLLRIISAAIAIVMLLVIAMRYMLSAPGDRADLKKHAVAYVVGAFILFGLTGILTILLKISDEIKV